MSVFIFFSLLSHFDVLFKSLMIFLHIWFKDIQRILHWIDHYHVANLHFQTSDHHRTLIITPTDECLPDLTTASFSRASIGIGGSILLREGQVRCIDLGGCQFTKRPIDRHLDLLVALGGVTEDGEIYRLEKMFDGKR